jgi:hypothetical protein
MSLRQSQAKLRRPYFKTKTKPKKDKIKTKGLEA